MDNAMKQVNTTLGPISLNQLGKVNVHEHVIIDRTNNENIPEDFHHTDVNLVATDLAGWREAGGGAIIDSSPIGAGRNVPLLMEVSRSSRVPIIISTGFHKLSYYPEDHWVFSASEDEIFEVLTRDCTQGLIIDDDRPLQPGQHEVKAHMLKIGVDSSGVTPTMRKIIPAVGQVSKNTGIPCMVHTEPGVPFAEVIEFLEQVKVPAEQVMICHMGKSLDEKLYVELAQHGYFLEFDEMIRSAPPLDSLASAIQHLFDQGYGSAVLFAGDLARRSYWTCYGGKPGLKYLITQLENNLVNAGLTRDMLDQIWIDNPKKLFT